MEVWKKRGHKPVLEGEPVPFIAPHDKQVGFTVGNFTAWLSIEEAAKIVNGWKSLTASSSDDDLKDFVLRF
jgi:hypothetical protein